MKRNRTCAMIALLLSGAGAAHADDNRLFILQENSFAALGNRLVVDQSLATGSTISGAIGTNTMARQVGGGNIADIRIGNTGGSLALNQVNTAPSGSNTATVDLGGLFATGILTQMGTGNTGTLNVSGLRATGLLEQTGNGNTGFVTVTGQNAKGEFYQNGNNNSSGLQVTGNGATVTLTQTGNNIVAAPSVITNGGTVIINQTTLP